MGYENGPFIILPNNTLVPNAYSWNKFAIMVYFEQPAGMCADLPCLRLCDKAPC